MNKKVRPVIPEDIFDDGSSAVLQNEIELKKMTPEEREEIEDQGGILFLPSKMREKIVRQIQKAKQRVRITTNQKGGRR